MKKFFSIFSVMAVVIAAMSFVSCSKDSNDPVIDEPTKPEEVGKSAYYSLMLNETYFEYGDVILTANTDGVDKEYSFLEKAQKLNDSDLSLYFDGVKTPARVGEGRIIYEKSVKFTVKFVLSDEGKKKLEAAPEEPFRLATIISFNGQVINNMTEILNKQAEEFLSKVNEEGVYNRSAN